MRKIVSVIFSIFLSVSAVFAGASVTPYGAASTVSGSCFLLETKNSKFIVDCGLFMSEKADSAVDGVSADVETAELKNLRIQPELIRAKALFLTHAHLDHSGRIPLLVHKGFKGKIYSTEATKELVLALFRGGAGFDLIKRKWFWSKSRIEKARYNNGKVMAHWTNACKKNIESAEYSDGEILLKDLEEKNVKFLLCKKCCKEETKKIENRFVTAEYNKDVKISDSFTVKFINAGHVPGSAGFIFTIDNQKVLFSGDLGSGYSRFNGMFDVPEKVDLIFMEATCACECVKGGVKQYKLFRNDLKKALTAGKTVWIPALSFNRTQKVLYELKLMQDDGELSKKIPIYSVSPSANAVTVLYQKEVAKKKAESEGTPARADWFLDDVYRKGSILPENVRLRTIRNYGLQMILISASGDMSKGKSEQLIPEMLPRKDVFIMIVNYVDTESNAGLLLQNKKARSDVESRAEIKKYDAFSDHANFKMLQKWLSKQNKNVEIYVIHSSEKNTQDMVKLLKSKGWEKVNGAKSGQSIK
ncbi:MBL fold metallo-hydrolase [Candidatus Endomicrobiellum agilis]|uniref:MBL fold metallo-hydrolase n=1 Tax=Candidatus Endomicrobiellum agilis TaxID=3238957 RepID=UPI003583E6C8|nr:MBL fold metallo-hydrolase [Endomicrobium sp.]